MVREKQEHNNRLVEWTKKKEGMRLKIVIPQANTHSNVAKEQHLVSRIYMKQWSYNDSNSVYIYEKAKPADGVHSASVYSINYIIGYICARRSIGRIVWLCCKSMHSLS